MKPLSVSFYFLEPLVACCLWEVCNSRIGHETVFLKDPQWGTGHRIHHHKDTRTRWKVFFQILVERHTRQLDGKGLGSTHVTSFDVTISRSGVGRFIDPDVHGHGDIDLALCQSRKGLFDRVDGIRYRQVFRHGFVVEQTRSWKT